MPHIQLIFNVYKLIIISLVFEMFEARMREIKIKMREIKIWDNNGDLRKPGDTLSLSIP